MSNISVGSICSGIEAASVAWRNLGFVFQWFSEIDDFPSRILKHKYPDIPNLGDMCEIPIKIHLRNIDSPDLICSGTPCQAFSLAGWKRGLEDDRGNLTMKFIDIIQANDEIRAKAGKSQTIVFWENVEGVLKDKTNAFGCFLSFLAGFEKEIQFNKYPSAGLIHGPKRNVAWRILDAKYFGLPQQRKRLYVLAGGKCFYPENILFELGKTVRKNTEDQQKLHFSKEGYAIEVFRSYTDCLYAAYGTKWNGNAASFNGSLFVSQNGRLRRFTPLECERLMGFPDGYTDIPNSKPTNRYKAIGNSWAVPVVRWLGTRLKEIPNGNPLWRNSDFSTIAYGINIPSAELALDLSNGIFYLNDGSVLNSSDRPLHSHFGKIFDIIDVNADENYYITPAGCKGILRRRKERGLNINSRLEYILNNISSQWSDEKIEEISRKQKRGRLSSAISEKPAADTMTISLFDQQYA